LKIKKNKIGSLILKSSKEQKTIYFPNLLDKFMINMNRQEVQLLSLETNKVKTIERALLSPCG